MQRTRMAKHETLDVIGDAGEKRDATDNENQRAESKRAHETDSHASAIDAYTAARKAE